jgi:pimeloyl-ACP methyl ester carboxylesterase
LVLHDLNLLQSGGYCLRFAFLSVLLCACATPAQRVDEIAISQGFQRVIAQGREFSHVVYLKGAPAPAQAVHIYLEGDGTPHRRKHIASHDPTPRNPLMLRLMALDSGPAIYLGRPCYYGWSESVNCSAELWTVQRYSPRVIDSMLVALANLLSTDQPVVLLGHSGGGALAMLLAERLPNVTAVITIAGNLDTDAWTELHDYSPLAGSINPITRSPLPSAIRQLHLAGGKDKNIPPEIIERAARRQPGAEFLLMEEHKHACCWERNWPAILAKLKK